MAKHRSAVRRGLSRWLAVGLSISLVVTPAEPVQAAPAAPAPPVPHTPAFDKPVPVVPVPIKSQPPNPASVSGKTPEVSWPAAGAVEVDLGNNARTTPTTTQVGGLPIRLAQAATARGTTAPASVRVELLDQAATRAAGVNGLLLRVRRTDKFAASSAVELTVDYTSIRHAYGGNWSDRLRLVRLPSTTLRTANDRTAGSLTAQITASEQDTTYAVTAGTAGGKGDHGATPLALTGTWQASGQTGEFNWTYPLRVPETPGALTPQLSVSYSSGAVDGRTASTNNQPSWVGEGFDLWSGSIERSYKSCADDKGNNGTQPTGDQCWFSDNATMSLAGHSGQLVRVGTTDTFRLAKDDGTKVERVYGTADNGDKDKEYWKATSPDGTQYFFGLHQLPGTDTRTNSAWAAPVFGNHAGEPCHEATFAASMCQQAYRWNLDYVIDKHGNTVSYYYQKDKNKYGLDNGRAAVEYDRGGVLLRAEFGTRAGTAYPNGAPAKVTFETAERCLTTTCSQRKPTDYPDVPFDLECKTATCSTVVSPTFWTTQRLVKITTYAGAQAVDEWTFSHSFPATGDGSRAALWLTQIGHSGLVGVKESSPPVTFYGQAMENRVNSNSDSAPPMPKYRITGIKNEFGGYVTVNYHPTNCVPTALPKPEQNPLRCFPVHWAPEGGLPFDDWMHKYVVANVVQQDLVGGSPSEVTSYDYLGSAAWRYADNELVEPKRRTWSEWRGYERVVVRHGNPAEPATPESKTEYLYHRGMNGDRLNAAGGIRPPVSLVDSNGGSVLDDDQLSGLVREKITYNGVGGAVVGSAITDYWQRGPTTTQGVLKAYMVETGGVLDRTALPNGTWRKSQVTRSYDEYGQVTQIDDKGDLGTGTDDECTRTWYTRNVSASLLTLPKRTQTVATSCSATAVFPADAVSDVRTYYDGNTSLDAVPSKGNATKVEQLADYTNGQPVYAQSTRTSYDDYGRPLDSFDALDRKTATSYTESAGLTTTIKVTNLLGHVTTTELAPAWSEPIKSTDSAGGVTEFAYDSLGRIKGTWLPGRSKARNDGPNLRYAYLMRNTGPSAVSTETLRANGNYVTSHALYDGFLRPRQTQSPGWGEGGRLAGRAITDTIYDSRGMVAKDNGQYYAEGPPGTSLVAAGDNNIPSQTITTYDGAGRSIKTTFKSNNVLQWESRSEHAGDHTKVTPPAGGTASTTYSDADGRVLELHQHRGPTPDGPADITKYTYSKSGQLATVTDPAGNQWRYTYDLRGRRVAVQDPDRGASTSTYDAAGQLLTATDSRGQTLAFEYDAIGRKTKELLGSATGPVRAEWKYDSLQPGLPDSSTRYENGHPYKTEVTSYEAGTNRPLGEKVTIPEAEGALRGEYVTSLTYRPDGSPASLSLPGKGNLASETLTYSYDDLGLVRTLSGKSTYVTDTWYTRFGEPSFLSMGEAGSKVWNSRTYDTATRRLHRAQTEREKSPGSQVSDLHYTYDAAGNVTSIADRPEGGVSDIQCFDHDYLSRIVEAWTSTAACAAAPTPAAVGGVAAYWTSYRYDVTGNRTNETSHGLGGAADTARVYTYPDAGKPQPHALASVTTSGPGGSKTDSYSYDATGNQKERKLAGATQSLQWDPAGRLSASTAPDGTATTITYDADGERLLRRDPASTTLTVGAQEFELNRATGIVTGTRFYSHGESLIAVRDGTVLHWQVQDHHSTTTSMIRADTLEVRSRRFTPFGDARGAVPALWPDERGFVGGTVDSSLGLTQLGARSYDAAVGRFVSVDPIIDHHDPQQMNGYAYANNNPATLSDPDGLFPDCGCPSDAYGYDNVLHNADGSLLSESNANKWLSPSQKAKWKTKAKHRAETKKRKQEWERKIRAAGYTPEEYEEAKKIQEKSVFDTVIEAGGAILSEFLGIEDIKGCFGKGNLGSCISMVINVIPWSKLFRVGELIGAVKKAWKAVTNLLKKKEETAGALKAGKKADEDLQPGGQQTESLEEQGADVERNIKDGNTRAENNANAVKEATATVAQDVSQAPVTPTGIAGPADPGGVALVVAAVGLGIKLGWQRWRGR